ncbi:hypothetical protein P3L10_029985 [Capsicum annuum]
MVNKLPNLIRMNRYEPFVTTMLTILLFKHYAGYSPSFPVFDRDVLARSDTSNGMSSLIVFRVGFWEIFKVWNSGGGGRVAKETEMVEGFDKHNASDQHFLDVI